MPSLPRTQPELLWTKPLPSPPRRTYAARPMAGADSVEGKAFLHEGTLWLTPGLLVRQPSPDWPALLGLDLATGNTVVSVEQPPGAREAHSAPFGDHIALAVRTKSLELQLVDRRTGRVSSRIEPPLERADALEVTNFSIVSDGDTLLVSWCEAVRVAPDEVRGQFRVAAIRDGRIAWRSSNGSLLGAAGGVTLTIEWLGSGEFRERAFSTATGETLWTGEERRQPLGMFAGAIVSKNFRPRGPRGHPGYAIAAADPRTGKVRWTWEHENVGRFAWGERHLATSVGDGRPLVILDDQGKVVLEDATWAEPGRGDARAIAAVDSHSFLWLGVDAAGRNVMCCSPLMDPRAKLWSIPEGFFSESAVFFDGGFVSLSRNDSIRAYVAGSS